MTTMKKNTPSEGVKKKLKIHKVPGVKD